MRSKTFTVTLVTLIATLLACPTSATTLDGTLKLGGIIRNDTGDLSAVQETYNIYDGFNLTELQLNGTFDQRSRFGLRLRSLNLDGRQWSFLYRIPGTLKFTAAYDQHRQVFDPLRAVASNRKDLRFGASYTPVKWFHFSGYYNDLRRDGRRLPFPTVTTSALPTVTTSALGTGYDNTMRTGEVSAEARSGGRGVGVSYRISDFDDTMNNAAARRGHVVSARIYSPSFFYDKWTHFLRGSWGTSKLSNGDVDYTLTLLQYTSVVRPVTHVQFKYNFDGQRVDDTATNLKTDRFINDFDVTVYHPFGNVFGGWGYETNDDDRSLTSSYFWRGGTALRFWDFASAKVRYAGRAKKDKEELTLLKDVDAMRIRADLEITPVKGVAVGTGFKIHEREYPDINVEAEGHSITARGSYKHDVWGGVSFDYAFSKDEYTDLAGGFDADSNIITGRVDLTRINPLRLSSGVTYLDIGQDLDIEKSIIFIEGAYKFLDDFHLEVKYNIYNYDDYVLVDRYYTANVLWLNVAYDLHVR